MMTTAEWMQGPKGILMPGNQYGSDNSIYAARILWKKPNHDWETRWLAPLRPGSYQQHPRQRDRRDTRRQRRSVRIAG